MIEVNIKESNNLKKVFYDEYRKELWVVFNSDQIYKYDNVALDVISDFKLAEDSGKFFYHNIRNKYKYKNI